MKQMTFQVCIMDQNTFVSDEVTILSDWRQILGVMKMKGENEGKIMFSGSENRNLGMRIATPRERERERERCHTNTTPTK